MNCFAFTSIQVLLFGAGLCVCVVLPSHHTAPTHKLTTGHGCIGLVGPLDIEIFAIFLMLSYSSTNMLSNFHRARLLFCSPLLGEYLMWDVALLFSCHLSPQCVDPVPFHKSWFNQAPPPVSLFFFTWKTP